MEKATTGGAKKGIVIAVVAACVSGMSFAQDANVGDAWQGDWSPLSISIVPAVEWPPADWDVYGLRLSIFVGKHHDVGGIDVGAIASLADGDVIGLQTSGIFSRANNGLSGCQISPLSFAGTLEGIQIGVFNRVEGVFGLQVGVVNYAYQANGVQLGLINIIADSELPILPVVNIGF